MDRNSATLALDAPAGRVKLVSPARAKALAGLNVHTVRDLLMHFPRRYIDLSATRSIRDARIGEQCTIRARVHGIVLKRPRPKLDLVEITLVDGTGTLVVTAFRQPWLMERISAGDDVAVAGKIEFDYGYKRLTNPFIEPIDGESPRSGEGFVIPVHPACEGISTAWMRRLVGNALRLSQGMLDPLPLSLRTKYRLMSRSSALRCIHFPANMEEADQARRRLVYEELLLLELMLLQDGLARSSGKVPERHVVDGPRMRALRAALPFPLTGDQCAALADILRELSADRCANHLVLGDVGTGKTVLAAFAVAAASDSGGQAFLMAPTEVLANQHCGSLGPLFDAAGITWDCLTGSVGGTQREAVLQRFRAGTVDVLIGTHALLEDDVLAHRLTLVIVDEQQRFGVDQRAALIAKGEAPDALYLTATPIPRTLALVLYGDLTLSYLHQKPHDTASRQTFVLDGKHKGTAYDAARAALSCGEQVFVVCPLVGRDAADGKGSRGKPARSGGKRAASSPIGTEEDPYEYAAIAIEGEGDYDGADPAAVRDVAEVLQSTVFADYRVDVLHGKMPAAEKEETMQRFKRGESQVLVATTVIEVGIDVPNATLMIVEDADRFGLSQLHQLRGRVGRGEKPGSIYLVSSSSAPTAIDRLAAMERTEDGFELARYDLSLRREGDILGNRQHGTGSLKLVNVVRDGAVIEAAHRDAGEILARDSELQQPDHAALAREVRLAFGGSGAKQGG